MAKGKTDTSGMNVGFDTRGLTSGDISTLIEIREDNTERIVNAINKELVVALEKIGLDVERNAKKQCPVDTGRLRNSITHIVDEGDKSVSIGTNAEYGVYVEFDDRKAHAGSTKAHFLRDSVENNKAKYKKLLEQALGGVR